MKKKLLLIVFLGLGVLSACKPLCPIGSCRSRMEHYHDGTVYRGSPWFKKQHRMQGEEHLGNKSNYRERNVRKVQKKK